ncbi:MAG: hypothetical protein DHS20C13_08860 [Thermodesulfobacteriota bacterium]|nr:MAG: hypothetical protein DHS20C13_08860 [Thermodesulfobacteriota bacterium]
MNQNKGKKIAYTISEAAQATGLSKAYLYKLSSQSKLPISKVGSRVIILESELLKYLQSKIRKGDKND